MKGLSELAVSGYATDYFGATFEVKPCSGFILVVYNGFRSAPMSEEAFSFILDEYMDQPYRRLVCDLRRASFPEDEAPLRERFRAQATALPRSTVVALCEDPSCTLMVAAVEEYRKAGHDVHATSDEDEALRLIRAGAPEKAQA